MWYSGNKLMPGAEGQTAELAKIGAGASLDQGELTVSAPQGSAF